VPKSIRFKNKT